MQIEPNEESEGGNLYAYLQELIQELTRELARYLSDRWRAEEDDKAISVDLSLAAALNRVPAQWLNAACQANQLTLSSARHPSRHAKVTALAAALTSEEALRRCVAKLPPRARIALRQVIENGGWMRLADLTHDFGAMDGDGWFWDEAPPTSCLGQLRCRALLFIGRASFTKKGKPGKRTFRVAVVPKDIRDLLKGILSELAIREEDEAQTEDLLYDTLSDAQKYYDALDWQPPIGLGDVEASLRINIEIFLDFVRSHMHEIVSMDDLCAHHVSELASSFLDTNYGNNWTLGERRRLVYTVRRLYDYLYMQGRILNETHKKVSLACARLVSGKRKLVLIHRPPPLGGEVVFARLNPDTGQEERYTFNHQRLLMVWAKAFRKDWRAVLNACETVPSGTEKAALVHELIALGPGGCDLIISQADEDDYNHAILWFNSEPLLTISAW